MYPHAHSFIVIIQFLFVKVLLVDWNCRLLDEFYQKLVDVFWNLNIEKSSGQKESSLLLYFNIFTLDFLLNCKINRRFYYIDWKPILN